MTAFVSDAATICFSGARKMDCQMLSSDFQKLWVRENSASMVFSKAL